jgi:hypothetical protein
MWSARIVLAQYFLTNVCFPLQTVEKLVQDKKNKCFVAPVSREGVEVSAENEGNISRSDGA